MHAISTSLLLSTALLCGAGAWAQTTPSAADLAKASGCYSCHANGEKVVGPAFASIAEKYAGDKDAAASLAQSIQNGSKGKWGRIPMPAHGSIGQDDLKALARHILATKG